MEEPDHQLGFLPFSAHAAPPSSLSLVAFSPCSPVSAPPSIRLCSRFTPSSPAPRRRPLAWVSLQGRLVNAEEASSAKSIGGLSREEAVAWELFTPIQRFLLVAVIGVAVAESRKNWLISQLKKSVELRDQVLSSMQQKLDNMCEQLNSDKNPAGLPSHAAFGRDKIKFVDCGCWQCDQHQDIFAGSPGNFAGKLPRGDEVPQHKMPLINEVEQEERRMSDLSDWASSVTSAAEMQMNTFAVDQDMLNLKRQCEEKDATINELTAVLHSTNKAGSKRIEELEDIIRRKSMLIAKLKKEMMVFEDKVIHLARSRRRSSSPSIPDSWQLPLMVDNIIYDMDSTTSPSSSDSDSPLVNQQQTPVVKTQGTPDQICNFPVETSLKSSPVKTSPATIGTISTNDMSDKTSSSLGILTEKSPRPTLVNPVAKLSTSKLSDKRSGPLMTFTEHPANSSSASPAANMLRNLKSSKSSSYLAMLTEGPASSRSASPVAKMSADHKFDRLSSLRSKQPTTSAGGEFKKIRRRTQTPSKELAAKKRWF